MRKRGGEKSMRDRWKERGEKRRDRMDEWRTHEGREKESAYAKGGGQDIGIAHVTEKVSESGK